MKNQKNSGTLFPLLHRPFYKNELNSTRMLVLGPIILGIVTGNLFLWITLLRGDNYLRHDIHPANLVGIICIIVGILWGTVNFFFDYAPKLKYNLNFEEYITDLQLYTLHKYGIEINRVQAGKLLLNERVPYLDHKITGELYLLRTENETNARLMFNELATELPVINEVSAHNT